MDRDTVYRTMDRAFDHCRNVPLDEPFRDAEIRSRYVQYVSRLECIVGQLVRSENDAEFVKRVLEGG